MRELTHKVVVRVNRQLKNGIAGIFRSSWINRANELPDRDTASGADGDNFAFQNLNIGRVKTIDCVSALTYFTIGG